MSGTFLGGSDPVALVLVVAAAVLAAVLVVVAAIRASRSTPRWLKSRMLRRRPDVIRRDLDRMAEYFGDLCHADAAVWRPLEFGLAAMVAHHWDQAIEHLQQARAKAGPAQLAPVLNQIGVCHYHQGRVADALREFEESASLAGREKDLPGRASALNNVAVIRHDYGELGSAIRLLREALALARESENQPVEGLLLGNIGNVLHDRDQLDAALRSLREALDVARRVEDERAVVCALGNIGSVLRDRRRPDKALACYTEALETAYRIDYKLGAAIELGNLGSLYRDRGELDRALKSHQTALELAHEVGNRAGKAAELGNIGLLLVNKGMHERAVRYLAESLTALLGLGAAHGPLQALYGLSKCDDSLGRWKVRQLLQQAGLTDAGAAETLDRIDLLRSRRPRRNPIQRTLFGWAGR